MSRTPLHGCLGPQGVEKSLPFSRVASEEGDFLPPAPQPYWEKERALGRVRSIPNTPLSILEPWSAINQSPASRHQPYFQQQRQQLFTWHLSPLPSQNQGFCLECEGIKLTGPSAVSEMNLITSTSFQRAPVVALQVYSSPGECQTKALLSFSVPFKQPFYFSELHLLGGSRDYHNTGVGFGRDASPSTLQRAGALGW